MLENYHVSEVFKELVLEDHNFLSNLLPEEYRIFRRRMIECILSTDMSNHPKIVSNAKNKLETFEIHDGKNLDKMIFQDNLSKTYENQQIILNLFLHTADISNPFKPASINKVWVDLLFVEFFNQGDAEKNLSLPVSNLCDRTVTDVNKCQIYFINCIAMPTLEICLRINPGIKPFNDCLKDNKQRYEKLVEES